MTTNITTMIELTEEEVTVTKAALSNHHAALRADQEDGADHGDNIDTLEGLNYKFKFIDD